MMILGNYWFVSACRKQEEIRYHSKGYFSQEAAEEAIENEMVFEDMEEPEDFNSNDWDSWTIYHPDGKFYEFKELGLEPSRTREIQFVGEARKKLQDLTEEELKNLLREFGYSKQEPIIVRRVSSEDADLAYFDY